VNQAVIQPWWVLLLRGAAAVVFGVLAFLWPGVTLLVLVTLFAAYALLGGAVSIFGAVVSRRANGDWGLLLLLGAVSIGAGAIAFVHPGLSALILVLLIGAHALVLGALDIIAAARSRSTVGGRSLQALAGLFSIIFGALVFLFPGAGALALIWLISLYALFTGILLLAAAFSLRGDTTRSGYPGKERRMNPDRRRPVEHAPAH
jgi:uncharacterized membrane protein HdeD (DUF308 family)